MGTAPTTHSVLSTLRKKRLADVGRAVGLPLLDTLSRTEQVTLLVRSGRLRFRELLADLGRDELKAACRAHDLDDSGRARADLQSRLLLAHGEAMDSAPPPALFTCGEIPRYAPKPGDIVACRHRQWLVEDVVPPPEPKHATRVRMVCLDDDDQGRVMETLWELELGARVLPSESGELPAPSHVDQPRHFGAYLHALKWNAVTATDARLFQSPFRAGIKLMQHQLTPLTKALSLPRANLFIADDVGLGKTIEAGLVLQELLLRQRVEFVLVICPASVQLQWKQEMQNRFGLSFEIMNRAFISRRRKERGFGVNPWSTHRRFIVSHPIVRRPEYRDPLLAHLSTLGSNEPSSRAKKSMLILDSCGVPAYVECADEPRDEPAFLLGRLHITNWLELLQPRKDGLVLRAVGATARPDRSRLLDRGLLGRKAHRRVSVGGLQVRVPQPVADRHHVHTGPQEMDGGSVPHGVRADPLSAQGRAQCGCSGSVLAQDVADAEPNQWLVLSLKLVDGEAPGLPDGLVSRTCARG